MTARLLRLDAIRAGVLACLRSYPVLTAGPAIALRPAETHTLAWVDDYSKGAELARASLLRASVNVRPATVKLAGLVLREMEDGPVDPAELEALPDPEREAWDALLVLLDNLLRTGDPDTTAEPETTV